MARLAFSEHLTASRRLASADRRRGDRRGLRRSARRLRYLRWRACVVRGGSRLFGGRRRFGGPDRRRRQGGLRGGRRRLGCRFGRRRRLWGRRSVGFGTLRRRLVL